MNNVTPLRESLHQRFVHCLARAQPERLVTLRRTQGLLLSHPPDDRYPSAIVCFSEAGTTETWLAISLGERPGSAPEPELDPRLPPQLLSESIGRWLQLPAKTQRAEEIHQEITQFGESLATSHTVVQDHGVWWLIPLGSFRPVGQLIHEHGTPPRDVVRDWEYQRRDRGDVPLTAYAVISPTGWVIDLVDLVRSLRASLGPSSRQEIERVLADAGIPTAEVAWPTPSAAETNPEVSSLQAALASAPRKPAPRRALRRPVNLRWIATAGATAIVALLAFGLLTGQSDRTDRTDRTDPSDPVSLETSPTVSPADEEIALPTWEAIDGHSLANTLAVIKPMDSMMMPPSIAEGTVDDSDDTDTVDEADEGAAIPIANQETASRVVQEQLGLETWGTRRDVRFGRGVTTRNGLCSIELALDTETNKDLVIQPEPSQSILGSGMCEWRIAKEDEDAELIIRVFSKPATKWRWMVQVGARLGADAETVGIAPGDAATLLDRLGLHARWLQESLDALQGGPPAPRLPGMAPPGATRSWLRTQQRETERAIRRWTTISELCDVLVASGQLQVEFSVASPAASEINK